MAQPTSNPKIEELRFRIKTDPKSRLFYPLAEELRKISQWDESERVLRGGLEHHPTYLSAWVSLGRVLRDQHKDDGAIEALTKALQLDPGNVVAARLLGDSYLTKGEKVEAIKKYKLVLALMPGDQEVESIVEGLEREINPIVLATVAEDEEGPVGGNASAFSPAAPEEPAALEAPAPVQEESPFDESPSAGLSEPASSVAAHATPFAIDHPMDETRPQFRSQPPEESPWDAPSEAEHRETTETPFAVEQPWSAPQADESSTGDDEPMRQEHSESPFEEPSGYTSAAMTVEEPSGMRVDESPVASEEPSIWAEPAPEPVAEVSPWGEEPASEPAASPWSEEPSAVPEAADVFAPAGDEAAGAEDVTNTLTMADLYVGQGQAEQARLIYERILERDPGNDAVRAKLAALAAPSAAAPASDVRVEKLGRWLSKVGRREGGGV